MITVKLFAILKDMAGISEVKIMSMPETVSELLKQVSRDHPPLADILSRSGMLISVNQEFAKPDTKLKDGDEVAIMPPFSGGSKGPHAVRVQTGHFSLDQEVARIKKSSQTIGAVVTFLGTTRDISRGSVVAKLDFEHYPGMAEKQLAAIREQALNKYDVIEVSIIHRVGTIPVGENIVLIVVAAAHRDAAFKACSFCIDELKRIAPIWKKEITSNGEVWVEEHP